MIPEIPDAAGIAIPVAQKNQYTGHREESGSCRTTWRSHLLKFKNQRTYFCAVRWPCLYHDMGNRCSGTWVTVFWHIWNFMELTMEGIYALECIKRG